MTPILVSVNDAAKLLGISRCTFYGLIGDGGPIDSVYLGHRRLVPHKALMDYAATLTKTPPKPPS